MLKYQTLVRVNSFRIKSIIFCRYNIEHRKDGPAKLLQGGDLFWYQYGQRHNAFSHALLYVDEEYCEYWKRGNRQC
jgi:hypothetical protein